MTDTTIYIGSFPVHEPMTVLTDLLISLLCFIYWIKLPITDPAKGTWRKFYFFFAWSTLVGACSHGLFAVHEGIQYKSVWLGMQLLNGLAVFFAEKACLSSVWTDRTNNATLQRVIQLQLVLFMIAVLVFQNFLVVVINNALGLIPVMVIHFQNQQQNKHYGTIGWGIAISFLTAVVHGAKISLHDYFNHNDLAHVFIMISLSVIYLGVNSKQQIEPLS